MKKILYRIALVVLFLTFSKSLLADFFFGLEWSANEDWRPNIMAGFKINHNKEFDPEDTDSKVRGWGSSISYNIVEQGLDKIELFRIEGRTYLQLEAGFGYSLVEETAIAKVGLQGMPDTDIGITASLDLLFLGGDSIGHIGINSLKKYDRGEDAP